MLGIQVSLRTANAFREGANIRWILNADGAPVVGVSYVWDDASFWNDASIWKD